MINEDILNDLNDLDSIQNGNSRTRARSESFESLLSPSYEQPLKVFSKIQSDGSIRGVDVDRGSCHAVKSAVSTLYNFEDFEMVKIGEGFFSEVFKVISFSGQIT